MNQGLPKAVRNDEDWRAVCVWMVANVGLGFHPDSDMTEYIRTDTGEPFFDPAFAAGVLQPLLDQARDCVSGENLYSIGMEVMSKAYPELGRDYRENTASDTLESLVSAGMIEPLCSEPASRQYHIPKLRHRKQTWMGLQDTTYILTVDEEADPGCRYTIESDSDTSAGEILLTTDDPDEVEAWIETRLEDADD